MSTNISSTAIMIKQNAITMDRRRHQAVDITDVSR
jgi:hypothetical protein